MAADRTEMVTDSVVIARLEERVAALQRALENKDAEVKWLRCLVETRVVTPPQQQQQQQKKEG